VNQGFWADHGDAILVAVVTAVLVLLAKKPMEALLAKGGKWLDLRLAGLGIRFKKRYLEALAEKHRWLKLIGIYSPKDLHPPRLREVYISLRLSSPGGTDGDRFSWSQAFTPESRRVAILGSPGAGKTTLLDYLVLVLTGKVAHPLWERLGAPLPLFARLRKLGADADGANLLDLLRASAPLSRLPGDFPERWLRRGHCAVLLDGLDEVLDEARHQKAVEEIERLVATYPDNVFLVTCRVAGWHNQLPGFRTYEIQELQDQDVQRFASAWYREVLNTQKVNLLGAHPETARIQVAEREAYEEARGQAENFWDQLSTNASLLLIARRPLILSLMLLLHHLRVAELPRGRAALYEECLNVLLEIWDRKVHLLPNPQGSTLSDKHAILGTIAYQFLEQDLLDAGLADLEEVVAPLLSRLSQRDLPGSELLRNIHERSGILVEQSLGRYGFAHRALADYLAARHVIDHELDARLLDRLGEERWREVTLIAVGLAPPARAERLVRGFLEAARDNPAALEMAGLSLAEEVHLGKDLRTEVIHRLRRRLDAIPEAERSSFGQLSGALMAADLEEARRWMADVLRGSDPALRERVLGLLPELGEEHGKPLFSILGPLIGAAGESTDLRSRAARALAALGVEPDPEIWHSLEEGRANEDLSLRAATTWAWCRLGRYEELGFVEVPAGEFLMGSPLGEGRDDERPQHSLFLPTYYIGRHPITVGRFREYVAATGRSPENRDSLVVPEDHPVVNVNWFRARTCARWFGATLPSEAEWEKAARGEDGWQYPWGEEWCEGLANTQEYWDGFRGPSRFGPWRRHVTGRRRDVRMVKGVGTTAAGAFSPAGDSPYGCADMAGNLWEWTRSRWAKYPYSEERPEYVGRERWASVGGWVLRGGAFDKPASDARCSARKRAVSRVSYYVGFRLAVSPFSSDR